MREGLVSMPDTVQTNAGYSKSGQLQEVYSRFNNHSISAKLWVYKSDRDLPQLMSQEGDLRKETQNDQNLKSVVSWKVVKEKSKMECFIGLNMNSLMYFISSTEDKFVNFDSHK